MKYLLMIVVLGISGCTSFRMSEEFGRRPAEPIKVVHVEFIEEQDSRVRLLVPTPMGTTPSFRSARQKAEVEIPKLRALLRDGVDRQLIPMLSERLSIEKSLTGNSQVARLRIQPTSGVVECGSGSFICQASVYVRLRLVGGDLEPIWVATYKVGAPLNGANEPEITQVFFSNIVERLESSSIIPGKAR